MGPDGRSRGFGFINFQEHGAVRWVLQETHVMDGRKLAGDRHKTTSARPRDCLEWIRFTFRLFTNPPENSIARQVAVVGGTDGAGGALALRLPVVTRAPRDFDQVITPNE